MSAIIKYNYSLFLFFIAANVSAQSSAYQFKVIHSLSNYILHNYVSTGLAHQMSDTLNWKLANNKYDSTLNPDEFAYAITEDLRRISHDEHIRVTTSQHRHLDTVSYDNMINNLSARQQKRLYEKSRKKWKQFREKYKRRTNNDLFTYGEIKILPGNVGYIEIKDFKNTAYDRKENKGRIRIEDIMRFLQKTNSIIIDLRDNLGGSVRQAAKFCSFFSPVTNNYFITAEYHYRSDSNGSEKEYVLPDKITTSSKFNNSYTQNKGIYILTSHRTFSAAETAIYKVKQYCSSAKIIGEKTNGGGNAYFDNYDNEYLSAVIPNIRIVDELNSNYSFEAKGIQPDIIASSDSAFSIAYRLAVEKYKSPFKEVKYFKKIPASNIYNELYFQQFYSNYVGDYRKIQIINQNNRLYMIYDKYEKVLLIPESITYFTGSDFEFIRFINDEPKQGMSIEVKHDNGLLEKFTKK